MRPAAAHPLPQARRAAAASTCSCCTATPTTAAAGYLAQVFPHVYFDVGLATHHTGPRSPAVIAESLELAPFAKILFSSDGYGPAELHYLGALLWRRGMTRVLRAWVDEGDAGVADAERIAHDDRPRQCGAGLRPDGG